MMACRTRPPGHVGQPPSISGLFVGASQLTCEATVRLMPLTYGSLASATPTVDTVTVKMDASSAPAGSSPKVGWTRIQKGREAASTSHLPTGVKERAAAG